MASSLCLNSCAGQSPIIHKSPRVHEPEIVRELKIVVYEIDKKKKDGIVLTDEEKTAYKKKLSLTPNQTLEVLRWGLKMDSAPFWE